MNRERFLIVRMSHPNGKRSWGLGVGYPIPYSFFQAFFTLATPSDP